MLQFIDKGVYFTNGELKLKSQVKDAEIPSDAKEKTLCYRVLRAHSVRDKDLSNMHFRFDTLVTAGEDSIGIVKKAAADDLQYFPVPYVLGAESEQEQAFALSAAKRFGGFYAPLCGKELSDYVCTRLAACGNMILAQGGTEWCGALGCVCFKGSRDEFDKQLRVQTFDLKAPELVMVLIEGELTDGNAAFVAKSLRDAVSDGRFAGKMLEFAGSGLASLTWQQRAEIDAALDETVCLATMWNTETGVKDFFDSIRRPEAFDSMKASDGGYYDYAIKIDLSKAEKLDSTFEVKTFDNKFLKKCYNGFPIPNPSVKLADI
ncbi:MAG: hypothetical protein IJE90_00650 [Clostridia bacterium]|nr:hypothetical protein [Clostridia bacterium]